MATQKSSASAQPPSHDHDDSLQAHYACLERLRPHACTDGVVYIGHLVISDDGEEVEVVEAVPCGRCAGEDV